MRRGISVDETRRETFKKKDMIIFRPGGRSVVGLGSGGKLIAFCSSAGEAALGGESGEGTKSDRGGDKLFFKQK